MRFADEERRLPQEMVIPFAKNCRVRIDGTVYKITKKGIRELKVYPNSKHRKSRIMVVKLNGETTSVSRIMRATYLKNDDKELVIRHKDGNYKNCAVWNLELKSRAENAKGRGGLMHDKARMIVKKDTETGEIVSYYRSSRKAAKDNYMSYRSVLNACNRTNKKNPGVAPDGYTYSWEKD